LEKALIVWFEKGAIMGGKPLSKGRREINSKAQLAIGMFEFQVNRLTLNLREIFISTWNEALGRWFIVRRQLRCGQSRLTAV